MTDKAIIELVCKVLDLDLDIMLSKEAPVPSGATLKEKHRYLYKETRQKQTYCEGRFIAANFIIEKNGSTLESIAFQFNYKLKSGKGDHSAALYWNEQCENLLRLKYKSFTEKFIKVKTEFINQSVNDIKDPNFKRIK